ncbi:hypothetical protein ABIE45_006321 [Methylobacterium sp. OAE515]
MIGACRAGANCASDGGGPLAAEGLAITSPGQGGSKSKLRFSPDAVLDGSAATADGAVVDGMVAIKKMDKYL